MEVFKVTRPETESGHKNLIRHFASTKGIELNKIYPRLFYYCWLIRNKFKMVPKRKQILNQFIMLYINFTTVWNSCCDSISNRNMIFDYPIRIYPIIDLNINLVNSEMYTASNCTIIPHMNRIRSITDNSFVITLQQCRHANNDAKKCNFFRCGDLLLYAMSIEYFFLHFFRIGSQTQKRINYCLRFSDSALSCALTN